MAPTVSLEQPQHMRALEHANRTRLARAALKRRIANGEVSVSDVILKCPWEAETMPIADLLMCQSQWAVIRTHKFLVHIPMSEHKTVGSLTERQRHLLVSMLSSNGAAA